MFPAGRGGPCRAWEVKPPQPSENFSRRGFCLEGGPKNPAAEPARGKPRDVFAARKGTFQPQPWAPRAFSAVPGQFPFGSAGGKTGQGLGGFPSRGGGNFRPLFLPFWVDFRFGEAPGRTLSPVRRRKKALRPIVLWGRPHLRRTDCRRVKKLFLAGRHLGPTQRKPLAGRSPFGAQARKLGVFGQGGTFRSVARSGAPARCALGG